MLNWADQFSICCFLDNHQYMIAPHSYECLLAVGAKNCLQLPAGNAFKELKEFSDQHPDWLFGHFSYDLKNETENLYSRRPDRVRFPDLFFFIPQIIIRLDTEVVAISSLEAEAAELFRAITGSLAAEFKKPDLIQIRPRFSKS